MPFVLYGKSRISVNKLKEKSEKTLKKRIICMKASRNHQFRATKFIEYLYFNQNR
jgi:flagellar biosynthesis regulator FlaF